MDDSHITTEQVEAIIARALELEHAGPLLGRDELRAIAREINISPEALERATDEILERPVPLGADAPGEHRLSWLAETLGAIAGGAFAGGVAGAGFTVAAVAIVLLVGVGLASRRDWATIARLAAQWVLLCGVFGSVAGLLLAGIASETLWALFGSGGLMAAAIVWLQERKGLAGSDEERPLLPPGS